MELIPTVNIISSSRWQKKGESPHLQRLLACKACKLIPTANNIDQLSTVEKNGDLHKEVTSNCEQQHQEIMVTKKCGLHRAAAYIHA
jgi:hypothetical protein